MYSYIIAKIISINKKTVTVEHNSLGFVINTPKPDAFTAGVTTKVYLYKHINLTAKNTVIEEFYGFKYWDEKEFFISAMTISGIGPKTAISFLRNDVSLLKQLISNKDTAALEQLPGVGKRYAYLLIEYLSDLYVKSKSENFDNIADVINVLKTLGYSQDDINYAINKLCETNAIESTMETSDVVSMAIKLISVKNEAAVPKA